MENSQLSWNIDPTTLKGLNDMVSSNLMTRFKKQTSQYRHLDRGRPCDTLNHSFELGVKPHLCHLAAVWSLPSYLMAPALVSHFYKQDHRSTHFMRLLGGQNLLKITYLVRHITNICKWVSSLQIASDSPRISCTRRQSRFGFSSSAGTVCGISTPDRSSGWEWPSPQDVASSGLPIWITRKKW